MFGKNTLGNTGIEPIKKIEEKDIVELIKKVSTILIEAYPDCNLSYINIYKTLLDTPMYYAKIPAGMAKVNYYYKNSSIYFKEDIDLSKLDEYILHEIIHKLQEKRDKHGNLVRIGICEVNSFNVKGMGLNEGAIQHIISKALNNDEKEINIYGIELKSRSNYYPLLSNLIKQLELLLGEEKLIESTLIGNEEFKIQIIDNLGFGEYKKIEKNMNQILKNTIFKNFEVIKNIYIETQNLIYTSYFNNIIKRVQSIDEIEEINEKIVLYKEVIGTTENYSDFDEFSKEFQQKIEYKKKEIKEKTSLMVIRSNLFFNIIRKIKKLFINPENEYNK